MKAWSNWLLACVLGVLLSGPALAQDAGRLDFDQVPFAGYWVISGPDGSEFGDFSVTAETRTGVFAEGWVASPTHDVVGYEAVEKSTDTGGVVLEMMLYSNDETHPEVYSASLTLPLPGEGADEISGIFEDEAGQVKVTLKRAIAPQD